MEDLGLNFETIGVNIVNGKAEEIATLKNICKDMADMFDYTDCNKKIWADLYCKTGNTLEALINNGVNVNNILAVCSNEQSQAFISRKLYHYMPKDVPVETTIKSLEAYKVTRRGQVYYVQDWKKILKENYQDAINIVKFMIIKEMEKTADMSLEFKSEENFTINNVIMNPPYNKGMDIDFDFLAFDVASDNVVCIQPAKCFSAEATQKIQSNHSYGNFRDRIVPHISNICFYPDSLDVFGTYQADGIMYFKADKHNTFDKATVKNISNLQDNINSVTVRNMTNGQTIWNVGNEMIEYMGRYKRLNIDTNTKGRYCVNINNQLSIGGGGFAVKEQDIDGRWVTRSDIVGKGGMIFSPNTKDIPVIAKVIVVDTSKKESMEEISGTSSNVFFSNDINECESYKSYILSKVVRFFTLIGVNKLTVIDNNTLKFVPAPPFGVNGAYKFDHIYTDEGLYRMCGLDKSDAKTSNGVRYIDIIESIIRDKK